MVVQQPGDLHWQTNCASNLQYCNTIRYLQKGLGDVLSETVKSEIVDSPGVKPLYHCSGFISSPFQVDDMSALLCLMKMGATQNKEMIAISKEIWEFTMSKEIMITLEYLQGRMNSSKGILRNLCEVGISRVGSFLHQEHAIRDHLTSSSSCLSTDAFQQSWKHRGLPYAFPFFQ